MKPRAGGVPGIKDVAREAGIGLGTASRALSGRGYVSPEAREKALSAARKLGYKENPAARRLREKSPQTVAVVFSLADDSGNPHFFSDWVGMRLAGMAGALRETETEVLFYPFRTEDENDIFEFVKRQRVRVVISHLRISPGLARRLSREDVWLLQLGWHFPREKMGSKCLAVDVDYARAATELVNRAVAHGWDRFLLLAFTKSAQGHQVLFTDGFRRACRRHRVKAHEIDLEAARIEGAGGTRGVFTRRNHLVAAALPHIRRLLPHGPLALVTETVFTARALCEQLHLDQRDPEGRGYSIHAFGVTEEPILQNSLPGVPAPHLELGRAAGELAAQILAGDAPKTEIVLVRPLAPTGRVPALPSPRPSSEMQSDDVSGDQ